MPNCFSLYPTVVLADLTGEVDQGDDYAGGPEDLSNPANGFPVHAVSLNDEQDEPISDQRRPADVGFESIGEVGLCDSMVRFRGESRRQVLRRMGQLPAGSRRSAPGEAPFIVRTG